MARFAAVILAAGESSRFGRPKQLFKFKHKSLVRRIVDEARDALCSPIIVVTGNAHDQVERELAGTSTTLVENESWKHGIGTSIRAGIRHLTTATPQVDAVVLLVCDQPFVDSNIIRDLIAFRDNTQKPIVSSRYADTLGVPALFNQACFDELLALDNESGAKAIILSNRERVAEFPFPDGAIDIDAIEDWKNVNGRVPT